MEDNEKENKNEVPTIVKKIEKTTYLVNVQFNETSKEDMNDKIKRMLEEEVINEG